MDDRDLELRRRVYGRFVELGRAPTAAEVGLGEAAYAAGLRRLHDAHALVLEPDEPARIRMLLPFSLVETAHRVEAGGRSWFANCAWDAFGICAALGVDGRIDSRCPDCGDRIELEVRDRRPVPADHVVHFVVPAARWWDDIVFT